MTTPHYPIRDRFTELLRSMDLTRDKLGRRSLAFQLAHAASPTNSPEEAVRYLFITRGQG